MNCSLTRRLACCATALFILGAFAPAVSAALTDQDLETIVAHRIKGDRTGANLAVAVIEGEHVARAFVAASGGANALRIGPNSAFSIGSISKTMTGVLLADLILRGEATLDDPLSEWLPEGTPVPQFEGQPIRLRHIVTHTSGLPALPSRMQVSDPENPYGSLTEKTLLTSLGDVSLTATPGTHYAYSNFAAMLLSYALAHRTETDFERLLRERLFTPLGMHGAHIAKRPKSIRAATGHSPLGKTTKLWTTHTNLAGGGLVRATLDDMVRYAQAQLSPPDDGIGPAIQLAQQPLQVGPHTQPIFWMQRSLGERSIIWHGGETGGFSAFIGFDREAQRAVIALSDTAWSSLGGLANLGMHLLLPDAVALDPPRKKIDPPQDLLDALAGQYSLDGQMQMALRHKKGRLFIQATGQPEFEMAYDSAGDFYPLKFDAVLRPRPTPDGHYAFLLLQGGGALTGTRVDTAAPPPALGAEELAAYTGKYPLMPGFVLTIRVKGQTLEAQATGQGAFPLQPQGKDRFAAPAFGVQIQFNRNPSGEVDSLALHQGGHTLSGQRE